MLLTLSEIKIQLRLEDDYTDEDELLKLIGSAVQSRTESFLNRTLYGENTGVPDNDPSVSEVEKTEMPQSFNWLVGPYRFIPL